MQQTSLSQTGNSLFTYAISRLSPDIFSHPIWMRFGQNQLSGSHILIDDLLSAAKNLEGDDPGTACQLLLICAVYQNYAGQRFSALKTAQQAVFLAEQTHLVREAIWAIWGSCAISFQQRDYDQAASILIDLQALLRQQNEWILANFVDVLRQSITQPGIASRETKLPSTRDRSFDDSMAIALDWLRNWGFWAHASETEPGKISGQAMSLPEEQSSLTHGFFSIQRWQGRWHTLMLAIRGELRLQWTSNDSLPMKRKVSYWGAILSYLRLHIHRRSIDTQSSEDLHRTHTLSLLPPASADPPEGPASETKTYVRSVTSTRRKRSRQVNKFVPVTVHMLGTFGITIGDAPVNIPSSRSLSVFKYLLLHHKQRIPREILMETFWPEAEPETARNSLNVAIHSLRQHLRAFTDQALIVFESGAYGLTTNVQIWIDVEEFERCHKTGHRLETRNQLTAAIAEYECAVSLYQGEFLEENPYEEWTVLDRERFRTAYLETLDRLSQIYFSQERYSACRSACQLILTSDRCREDAHCLLMRCYSRQGQYPLALQQYQRCVEALRDELDVEPAPETTQLYEALRRRERL